MKKYIEAYIQKHLSDYNPTRLRDVYDSLSATYRQHRAPTTMNAEHVLAYLLARFPATFGVCDIVLSQLTHLKLTPSSLLEVGAGPGTGTLAALEHFPSLRNLTLIEKERAFLSASQEIFLSLQEERPLEMVYLHQSYNLSHTLAPHDLVISSYFLNELPPAVLPSVIESLWSTTGRYLILVEPGTPVGFDILRQARTLLIKENATIVAPCTHNNPCPLSGNRPLAKLAVVRQVQGTHGAQERSVHEVHEHLSTGVTPQLSTGVEFGKGSGDWCHFSQRIQRDKLHQAIKGTLPYEDEKYSYLIASKSPVSCETSTRIIKRPLHHSGHLVLPLCTPEGLKDVTLTKGKDKDRYKKARHLEWGDGF